MHSITRCDAIFTLILQLSDAAPVISGRGSSLGSCRAPVTKVEQLKDPVAWEALAKGKCEAAIAAMAWRYVEKHGASTHRKVTNHLFSYGSSH